MFPSRSSENPYKVFFGSPRIQLLLILSLLTQFLEKIILPLIYSFQKWSASKLLSWLSAPSPQECWPRSIQPNAPPSKPSPQPASLIHPPSPRSARALFLTPSHRTFPPSPLRTTQLTPTQCRDNNQDHVGIRGHHPVHHRHRDCVCLLPNPSYITTLTTPQHIRQDHNRHRHSTNHRLRAPPPRPRGTRPQSPSIPRRPPHRPNPTTLRLPRRRAPHHTHRDGHSHQHADKCPHRDRDLAHHHRSHIYCLDDGAEYDYDSSCDSYGECVDGDGDSDVS